MAITVTRFDHTLMLVGNQGIDYTNLKVMLTNGYTLATSETTMTNVSAAEVSGNGWSVGGELIANAAWAQVNTNDSRLDGDDISVTASGGSIGPADAHVVYDATNNLPLIHVDFGESKQAGDTTQFKVSFATTGIIQLTV